MIPTIGRIVHYYNPALNDRDGNGVGQGPYPAIITQTWLDQNGEVSYCNLRIFAWNNDHYYGSVPEKDSIYYSRGVYWEWPPIV